MKKSVYLIILFFVSCNDNNFIYAENQHIISCIDKGIYNLSISSENNDYSYEINWVDSLSQPPTIVNLDKIDKGFKITKYIKWKFKIINNKDFKLFNSEKIKIKRHQGDAISQEIEVITNANGKITKSSRNNCEYKK